MPGITQDIEIAIPENAVYEKHPVQSPSGLKNNIAALFSNFFQPIQIVTYDSNLREGENNC